MLVRSPAAPRLARPTAMASTIKSEHRPTVPAADYPRRRQFAAWTEEAVAKRKHRVAEEVVSASTPWANPPTRRKVLLVKTGDVPIGGWQARSWGVAKCRSLQ